MISYYLAQKYGFDYDGYHIPINHSHLCAGNLSKSLCGLNVTKYGVTFVSFTLKKWIVDKTTCKKCKYIANKIGVLLDDK